MQVSWPLKDLNVISFEEKVKPLYSGHLLIADTFSSPDCVHYREVSLDSGSWHICHYPLNSSLPCCNIKEKPLRAVNCIYYLATDTDLLSRNLMVKWCDASQFFTTVRLGSNQGTLFVQ